MFGETPGSFFGEHKLAVDLDLENPATRGDQLCLHTVPGLDVGCQTGCLGVIVSNLAEFNSDTHRLLLIP